MAKHTVTLMPSGLRETFPPGTLLSEALLFMGVPLKTPCGGKGTCGKCRVRVEGMGADALACRTLIEGDLRVFPGGSALLQTVVIPNIEPDSRLSAAIDIGTTTVKVSLVDTTHKTAFAVASFLNPQQRFGHDVISRIAAAADPTVRLQLGELIRRAIRLCLERVLAAPGIAGGMLETAVFAGNTTMLSLLFGLDVGPLGRYPYAAPVRDFTGFDPGAAGLEGLIRTEVHALPALSAFIGADLIGSLTLCQQTGAARNTFFIDLGTNGELFCRTSTGLVFATSCAMGPALEGMNISWGMSVDEGAIFHVRDEHGRLAFDMMGSGEPAGITGTALVDLLAILLERGIVTTSGAFSEGVGAMDLPPPLAPDRDGQAQAFGLWGRIRLTQKDVRNVQLAKAASRAASRFLLEAAGCGPEDIEHVFIAGAFGEHLDLDHFRRLGFIPSFKNARFSFLGNTSLKASELACMDQGFLNQAAMMRDTVQEVVLSGQKGFQEAFIRAIDFPGRD